jgi:hypothetical protein
VSTPPYTNTYQAQQAAPPGPPPAKALLDYKCCDPILADFHASLADVRLISGCRGSGKSQASQVELFRLGMDMPPQADGVRRSRYVIVRSSYRALEMSALATHKQLFASMKGWNGSEIAAGREPWRSTFRIPLPDGTRIESEWLWLAVDDLSFDKLRSVEYTAWYANELCGDHNDLTIITKLQESAGRYPPKSGFSAETIAYSEKHNKPIYRAGGIADYNPGNDLHPLRKAMDMPPSGWEFFVQVGALMEIPEELYDGDLTQGVVKNGKRYVPNPEAVYSRIHNAGSGYWMAMLADASQETIDSSILGKFSKNYAGKPVYPTFNEDSVLRQQVDFATYSRWPITIGIDSSGVNPAAVIASYTDGKLFVLDELYTPDTSFEEFIDELLMPILVSKYSMNRIVCVLDPSNPRAGTDKRTALQMLHKAGLNGVLAPTNFMQNRLDAVTYFINRRGALHVAGHLEHTLAGLRGAYRYKPLKGQSGVYQPTPEKNAYSHTQDALQYVALHVRARSEEARVATPIQLKSRVRKIA